MTEQQFKVLADLLGFAEPDRDAVHATIFDGARPTAVASEYARLLHQADAAIRGAYVIHGPMEFRITVGHRDVHRMPGSISIEIGDMVRLVAHTTPGWIPVQVTALPETPVDYYTGVIIEQIVRGSRYQAGNGVKFSEDQVMVEEPRAASRRRHRY